MTLQTSHYEHLPEYIVEKPFLSHHRKEHKSEILKPLSTIQAESGINFVSG
jgi:hypothetical protein